MQHLDKRRQRQFLLLLFLMFIASLAEIISIGSVLPFLGILTDPVKVYQHSLMQPIIQILSITKPSELMLPVTILFITAALLAGLIRLTLLYTMTRLSFATGADLSINIYRRTLYQEYEVHVLRSSSEIINGIITKTSSVIGGVISPTLNLISSTILFTGIIIALFTINPLIALSASLSFGILYLMVIYFTKTHLKSNSKTIADQSTQMIKSLQEGLGAIREVLIDGSQQFYCKNYRNADLALRRASGNNQFINGSPRFIMEAVGMVIIALLAYIITQQNNGVSSAIPVLGALALGVQRLLPALQQAYASYSAIKGAKSSFEDVMILLNQPLPKYADQPLPEPIPFEKEIKINNLGFRYTKGSPWVLRHVNLTLKKGSRTGFMGVTGSGKSTLLDIIIGLLKPTEGELVIDNQKIKNKNHRSWQAHIAHVSQSIYLSDSTILENIAFGVEKKLIDYQRVKKAAQQAQIADSIELWKDGYETFVGERGVRLSGGQRQRIGIARALYKQADVLIFDEATSALDNETELAVMDAIENLSEDLTILIVAHRLTTLKKCDQIIKLKENHTIHMGSYEEIFNE